MDATSHSTPSDTSAHAPESVPQNVIPLPGRSDMWSRERAELVRRTVCPKGITEDEFTLFLEQCKRSGLDPLLKEAFCVARRQNVGNKERPQWVSKHEFTPSEAGMLARAERFPDFRGIQASAVFGEDDIIVDQGKGEVQHRFNPAKRKGALVGAWARVVRDGKLPVVVWLDFGGYVQQTPLWAKIPTTMIEKCARVAALRKAYPEAFGGLYVREEMPQDDYEAPLDSSFNHDEWTAKPSSHQKRTVAAPDRKALAYQKVVGDLTAAGMTRESLPAFFEQVLHADVPSAEWNPTQLARVQAAALKYVRERVTQKVAPAEAAEPTTQPATENSSSEAPAPEGQSAADESLPPTEAVPPTVSAGESFPPTEVMPPSVTRPEDASAEVRPASVLVAFGPYKGKTVAQLSDAELTESIDMALEKLLEQPAARWANAMRSNLEELEVEAARRCHAPSASC